MITVKTAAIMGFALVAIIVGIDVYLAVDSVKGNTWSEMLRAFSFKSPFAPWVWGGLGGHFFHQWIPKLPIESPGNIALLVWLSFLIMLIGHTMFVRGTYLPPAIVFFAGFLVWSTLWPV
jgi:hypothetical protein